MHLVNLPSYLSVAIYKNKNNKQNKKLAAGSVTLQKQKSRSRALSNPLQADTGFRKKSEGEISLQEKRQYDALVREELRQKNANMTKNKNTNSIHFPVMAHEVLEILDPKPGQRYLDVTAGYGGHAGQVLERTLAPEEAVLVDRDQMAIDRLHDVFQGSGAQIIHKDFLSAARGLLKQERTFDLVLADLGVSSPHLNTAGRGFSFRYESPLDMRMDQRQELTAGTIINSYDAKELAGILRDFGEEPKAQKIAELLVAKRPITTTTELAEIVALAWPGYSRTHPATRTFQALRIAVNDELRLVKEALPVLLGLLSPGGRLAVISFHSLEDRIVKQAFAEYAGERYDSDYRLLTRHPLIPSPEEIVSNPRSRSAKLRAVAKINTKKKGDA